MKKCSFCGHFNTDNSGFCEFCGNQLEKEVGSTAQKTSENLIAPNETVQATIGVSYIQNLMSGEGFKYGAAILTDKRLYYFGRSFSNVGRGSINTETEESIVSVEDITGTRFVHGSPVSLLVTAIASFVLAVLLFISTYGSTDDSAGMMGFLILVFLILGAVFLVAYYAGRDTVLEIRFPGGKHRFSMRWHSLSNMREFQRQIHVVKDSLKAGQCNGKNDKTEASQ